MGFVFVVLIEVAVIELVSLSSTTEKKAETERERAER